MATYRAYAAASPPTTAAADFSPISNGLEFYVTSAATVTQIHFWQPTTDASPEQRSVGIYVVSTGLIVGTAETLTIVGTGWQTRTLTTPISLTANTRYRVVVYSPGGAYAATSSYFTSGAGSTDLTNGILKVPSNANATGNIQGSYNYATNISYPNTAFSGANYWVDVTVADGGVSVAAVAATGTGAAGVPTVSNGSTASVTAVRAQGTGSAEAPVVTGSTVVTGGGAATGTGAAGVPVVSGGTTSGSVTAVRAQGTGAAGVPVVAGTQTGTVVGVRAQGVGAAIAPTVAGVAHAAVAGVRAQGSGLARTPTVVGGTVTTLPVVVTHGAVKAWLGSGVNVSPDADGYADLIPDVGTVTFTPVASVLTFPTASPAPLILTPRVVVCTLDSDGYLIGTKTGAAEKLVRLIAGDWTVSYQLTGVTLPAHKITVTGGVTLDLADVMPT